MYPWEKVKLYPVWLTRHLYKGQLNLLQTDKTLLANNSQRCCQYVVSICPPCYMLLGVIVVQSLKPIKLLSQQLPSFLLFHDCWSIEQQCCVLLPSSSIIVGAIQMHYTWSPKQRAKKVMSDSPGLMDFAIGLVIFVLKLPHGQVLFFGKIQLIEGL